MRPHDGAANGGAIVNTRSDAAATYLGSREFRRALTRVAKAPDRPGNRLAAPRFVLHRLHRMQEHRVHAELPPLDHPLPRARGSGRQVAAPRACLSSAEPECLPP